MSRFKATGPMKWLAAVGVLWVVGCAHVNRDELSAELDQVRQEIQEGDRAVQESVDQQIASLESRLGTRLAALEDGLHALSGEFDVAVERMEAALRFNAPVHFDFDDSTVREQDRAVLDRFAQVVQGYYDDALITIEGFTDTAGDPAYNQQLGLARAEAVKQYLVTSGGLREDRLRTVSYGAQSERQVRPGARGPGGAGWENRRVAMVVDFGSASSLEGEGADR